MNINDNVFTKITEDKFDELFDRQKTIMEEDLPLFPNKETYFHALMEIKRLRQVVKDLTEPKGEA